MCYSRPLFLYFRLFNTLDSKQMFDKILPMTGFEPQISGVEGDHSTHWATTTVHEGRYSLGKRVKRRSISTFKITSWKTSISLSLFLTRSRPLTKSIFFRVPSAYKHSFSLSLFLPLLLCFCLSFFLALLLFLSLSNTLTGPQLFWVTGIPECHSFGHPPKQFWRMKIKPKFEKDEKNEQSSGTKDKRTTT